MIENSILQGLTASVLYVIGVAFALRLARRSGPALVAITTCYVVFLIAIPSFLVIGHSMNVWAFAVSYWFFAILFLVMFGAVYKSISLRILLDLLEKPQQTECYQVILDRYIIEDSYQARLDVIEQRGLAVRHRDQFALTERGCRIARLVRAAQEMFGIRRSG